MHLILTLYTHSSCTWHVLRTEPVTTVSETRTATVTAKGGPYNHDGVPKTSWIWGPRNAHIYGVCKFLWHRDSWSLCVSFIQNHSAITQLFYLTSSNLKPIAHVLLYSEMLRERTSSSNWKVSQKTFSALCAGTLPALAQCPPISQHLPTPLHSVD